MTSLKNCKQQNIKLNNRNPINSIHLLHFQIINYNITIEEKNVFI